MFHLPARVDVVEVGPRDGLQSLTHWVDTDRKIAMIDRLSAAGFPVIEVTSFAHPKVVPHLVDAEEVIARIERRPGTVYRALVPNKRGALRAAETDIDEILGLMTISEAYLAKNQNMSLDGAIEEGVACYRVAEQAGKQFVMALGMAFYCVYEGLIAPEKVLDCIHRLRDGGITRFYLAASTGMEEPRQISTLFAAARDRFPDCEFGFHVHERMGLAPANLLAALDAGAASVEGSICGIGGGIAFPGGTGQVGNLASEDIVNFLNEMGIETGIATEEALACARDVAAICGVDPSSRLTTVGSRREAEARAAANPAAHPV